MEDFPPEMLKDMYTPPDDSSGEDNGQVTIIGGSELFHGAPIFALKAASRIVDMVFFTSPETGMHEVSVYIKATVPSFIWVPWEEVEKYIDKSDAILIGPGFMRYSSEKKLPRVGEFDEAGTKTREITKYLLLKYPHKKWVIDAGSLQVMDPEWIPENSILTPNKKEFEMLFGDMEIAEASKKYRCVIVRKGKITTVCSSDRCYKVKGGNAGMTKGGTGDVGAGVTVALLAKNEPFLAASAAAYLTKKAGERLEEKVGFWFNAEDLADEIKPF